MSQEPKNAASQPPPPDLPTPPEAVPFAPDELTATARRPHRLLDVVLGERRRLAATLRGGDALPALLLALLVCSLLAALPFAAVDGGDRVAHVAALFLGSVLLCYPSLQVFGAYLGVRLKPAQCLAIALVIPSAAALFTLGFAPIYWFLQVTMPAADADLNVTRIVLLVLSLVLALSHVNRCLYGDVHLAPLRDSWALWAGWQLLVVFLTWRMAETLGMLS
ncbi:MAG: hypothetical protein ACON4Z_01080 [Planctomycetota bacterium]